MRLIQINISKDETRAAKDGNILFYSILLILMIVSQADAEEHENI